MLRPIVPDDLPHVGDLLDSVFRRSRGVLDQQMCSDFPLVFQPANYGNCRVIVEDGRIVSHAAMWPRETMVDGVRLKVGTLASVATHPDWRLRGHAARLVQSLVQTLREQCFDLGLLWTAFPDFYRKLGWELFSPQGTMVTTSAASWPAVTGQYALVPFASQRHLVGVMALHEREPVRFLRSPSDYQTLFSLPKIHPWVAELDGSVAAYLVLGTAVNKQGLIEYGGAIDGIMALAGHLLHSRPGEVSWLVYHLYPELAAWAQSLGLPSRPLVGSKGTSHEMILVLNSERVTPDVRRRLFTWGLDHV